MKLRFSRNLFVIVGLDISLLVLSFYLAHLVRFDFHISQRTRETFTGLLPYVLAVKLGFLYYFDLYRGMWRYTGLNDLLNVIKALVASSVTLVVFVLWRYRFEGISRSVFLIDFCFTLIFISGLRIATRMAFEQFSNTLDIRELLQAFWGRLKKEPIVNRALIIGAGDCGEKISREIKDNSNISYKVVGFLDDDSSKIGRKIHGIPVLNEIKGLDDAVKTTGATEVIIAVPSCSASRMKEILEICKTCGVQFKTVPGMGELINGKVTVKDIREVEYRDLLGRKPVSLEEERIGGYLKGQTVLVTGAGGSIGSGLCRQVARYSPACIILLERAESPLYEIERQLKNGFENIRIVPCLGDIQNRVELQMVFEEFRPEIVFHAAAYKHVPMLETQPWKAVENNICGTENLAKVADTYGCEKFVFVSTDKAVNPVNVMGVSKRVSEMIIQNRNTVHNSRTSFITVRFGNVIGSVGSVIPLFKNQIKAGGPVTVTHPDMIRYFMLIPEACQLILQAGAMGKGGEIFILEMGQPVKITEMAKDLIKFSGFEPDVDIKVEYTGLRPGEKLYEELMTDLENVLETRHESILVLNGQCCNMRVVEDGIKRLKRASVERNAEEIKHLLKSVVPEYEPFQAGTARCRLN